MAQTKDEIFYGRLTPKLKQALALRAKMTGQTMVDVIRAALVAYLTPELLALNKPGDVAPPQYEIKQPPPPASERSLV